MKISSVYYLDKRSIGWLGYKFENFIESNSLNFPFDLLMGIHLNSHLKFDKGYNLIIDSKSRKDVVVTLELSNECIDYSKERLTELISLILKNELDGITIEESSIPELKNIKPLPLKLFYKIIEISVKDIEFLNRNLKKLEFQTLVCFQSRLLLEVEKLETNNLLLLFAKENELSENEHLYLSYFVVFYFLGNASQFIKNSLSLDLNQIRRIGEDVFGIVDTVWQSSMKENHPTSPSYILFHYQPTKLKFRQ